MMKERDDLNFFFVTKRPERFSVSLPDDWGDGYENVHICCTCENQRMTDKRLPLFLELPIRHKSIIHEPMLESINIRPLSDTVPRLHRGSDLWRRNPVKKPESAIMPGF